MIPVFGVFFHPTDEGNLGNDIPIFTDFDAWEPVGMDQFIRSRAGDAEDVRHLQDGQVQG